MSTAERPRQPAGESAPEPVSAPVPAMQCTDCGYPSARIVAAHDQRGRSLGPTIICTHCNARQPRRAPGPRG